MKIDTIQTNFSGGEFSPRLFGRTDIAQYANACAIVENMLVRPYGALISTPGTEFVNDAKFSNSANLFGQVGDLSNIALLLHLDTNFNDSSPYNHIVTTNATPTIDTILYEFGGGSGYFTITSGSALLYPSHSIFDLSNNDFTMECWFSLNIITHNDIYLSLISKGPVDTTGGFRLSVFEDFNFGYVFDFSYFSSGIFKQVFTPYLWDKSGSSVPNLGITLVADTLYHVRLIRSSGYLRLYFDGNELPWTPNRSFPSSNWYYGYTIGTTTIGFNASFPLAVGATYDGGGPNFYDVNSFDGNIEEVLIVNNVALANPIPPTTAYSTTNNTIRARLIPFIFSREDSYVIEAGPGYFRFYTDGAVVTA